MDELLRTPRLLQLTRVAGQVSGDPVEVASHRSGPFREEFAVDSAGHPSAPSTWSCVARTIGSTSHQNRVASE